MFVRGKSIGECWGRILEIIWYQGEEFKSQRGSTKEIRNLMVKVAEPRDENIPGFPMAGAELAKYADQLLSADRAGFDYTYGERLRSWGEGVVEEPVDQISEVASILKKDSSTRRATCVTWIPPKDLKTSEVPCLILLDFKVRHKILHATAVFRSNDMFGAWPANVYGLNKVNEYVAKKIKAKSGSITTHSISAHIYDHDYKNVEKKLGLI
ncbi:MAG: thymidylate synthase [Candidatus Altiarchaeota archaeon]